MKKKQFLYELISVFLFLCIVMLHVTTPSALGSVVVAFLFF